MEKIRKYPVEIVVILAIFYTIFFSSSWSGSGLINKLNSMIIVFLIFSITVLTRYAWPAVYESVKRKVLYILSKANSSFFLYKIIVYSVIGSTLIFSLSFLEFFTTLIFFGEPLVIGFPYPFYAVASNHVLFVGMFLDVTLYSLLIYLVTRIIFESKDGF